MLERITPLQIRICIFINSIDGSWTDNPFWRQSFLVKTAADVERLRRSSVASVVIDESRGARLDPPPPVARRAPSARDLDIRRTKAMIGQAKQAVRSLFSDARLGRGVNAAFALSVVEEIGQSMQRDPRLLIDLTRIKSRDENTFLHSIAVSGLMIRLGTHLQLDSETISGLGIAGLLHDIGKAAIPSAILNKEGPLSPEERAVMETHPERGHEMLVRQGDMPDIVLDVCLHHHRRVDGDGYPQMATGEPPSLPARIAAICDVYDAVTSIRPYEKPWRPAEALARMRCWEGQFDPEILSAFITMIGFAETTPHDTRRDEADTDSQINRGEADTLRHRTIRSEQRTATCQTPLPPH